MMISGLVYPDNINSVHQTLLEEKDMVTKDQVSGIMVKAFIRELWLISRARGLLLV